MTREVSRTLVVLIGVAFDAFGVNYFLLPYNFPVGGVTGISRVINHYAGLPISVVVGVMSITMLVLGFFLVGRSFAAKTVIGSIAYPLFLAIYENVPAENLLVSDRLLAGTFAGLFMGIGLGLCVRNDSSTGGTDLIGVILNKKLRVPVATTTYVLDAAILATQLLFGNFEDILYGIYVVILCSIVMNKVITMGGNYVQMFIVSEKHEEINARIQETREFGSTLLYGETGRFKHEAKIIICTVKAVSVVKIRDIIYDIDQTAFITMTSANEVYGRGFSMERIFKEY